jgi:hypothetical protein
MSDNIIHLSDKRNTTMALKSLEGVTGFTDVFVASVNTARQSIL